MMNQSIMSLNRKTTAAGILPYQLYCGGGSLPPKAGTGAAAASPAHFPTAVCGEASALPSGAARPRPASLPPLSAPWAAREDVARLGYNTEGSLPCSQEDMEEAQEDMEEELEEGSVSRGSTSPLPSPTCPRDAFFQETFRLLLDYFKEYAGEAPHKDKMPGGYVGNRRALETLRRVGGDVIEKHKIALQGMLQRLTIRSSEDLQKLSNLPSEVFSDGITNWGRIVTLISFGAFVAKYLKSIHLEHYITELAENFTHFLMTSKREWIVAQKGWDGFVEFFHVEDYEGGLRTVLMAFAGVAGIGASLAYMIR